MLQQRPRLYGQARSRWTLNLVADVCLEQGLTRARVSADTMRVALRRLGVSWQRARAWMTSPDPADARNNRREID